MVATTGTVNCTTPCATLTATPNMTLNETSTYAVGSIPYAPFSYTTGTAISTTFDDLYTTGISIPFCFNFFGVSYTTLYIGSNGNVSFNSLISGAYDPWAVSGPLPGSNCNATFNAIMSPWCDIYPPGGGSIRYATYGTAPCRSFVVSFNSLTMFLPGTYCTGTLQTSQIVLHETSNIIDIFIGTHNSPLCTTWNGGRAVTGIENMAGTVFYTPPGQNGTAFTATNQGWRFTPSGIPFPWSYTWTGPSGSIGTSPSVVVCPTVATTYTVSATATAACGPITIVTTSPVTVISSPVTVSGPNDVCVGSSVTLTTAATGGSWGSSNTSVATVSSGVVTGVSVGTASISYSLGSCVGSHTVTVDPVYSSTLDVTICQGQTYSFLGASLTLPGVYRDTLYTVHGCDSAFTLNLTVNPTYTTDLFDTTCDNQPYSFFGSSLSTTGVYNHTLTTVNGCDSTVVLHLAVYPTYSSTSSGIVCQGDSYLFGGTYYNSSGTYTKTLSSIYGCDSVVTLTLVVKEKPKAEFYVTPYKCVGDTITVALSYISSDILTYSWNFNPATIITATGTGGPFKISYPSEGVYTISLVTSNLYCTDTTVDTIKIMKYPDATIDSIIYLNNSPKACVGDEILLQPKKKDYTCLYYWSPSNVVDNPNVSTVKARIENLGCIVLQVMNPYGCKAKDSVCVTGDYCCEMILPAAFTPNGDGKNDVFRIISSSSVRLRSFEIVNRFGQIVFETCDLSGGWDGFFGGVAQDMGVYFYYILYDCEGKQLTLKGDVTLIR
jgi:gliding motility-associated-like protein